MRKAVVDQSGLKIVVIGIVISVFLGLIFKSQIRSNVIKARLEKTLVKLQKDINIDFESVEVQLSDWGIPRPVVIINGIRISPLNESCNENQIYIESLSFPLSINLIVSPNKTINSIHMSLVEVRLKNVEHCFKNNNKPLFEEKKSNDYSSSIQSQVLKVSSFDFDKAIQKSSTHLKDINIDRLRIISLEHLKTAIDFNAVQANLRYTENKLSQIQVQSQLMMFKDIYRNLYLLKAESRLTFDLTNSSFIGVDADLSGLILDRPLKIKIKTDSTQKTVNLFGEFKSISLKALNYLIQSENPQIENYDFLVGSTLSGYLTGEYSLEKHVGDLFFNKVKVYFGGGTVDANEIHLSAGENFRLQLKPFDAEISRVDLTKLSEHSYFSKIKSSVQRAGSLSGLLQYDQNGRIRLNALLEDVSFYFSNKGVRLSQTFDRFNLKLILDNEKNDLIANDFIYNGHKILGQVHYLMKKKQELQTLSADLEGEILNHDVVKLFTGLSYQPFMSLNFQTDFKSKLTGKGTLSQFNIDNVNMEDVFVDYSKDLVAENESFIIKAKTLKVSHSDDEDYILNQFFGPNLIDDSVLNFQSVKIDVVKNKMALIKFKADADLKNEKNIQLEKFKLNGLLDGKLKLIGDFEFKSGSKKISTYSFSGDYDQLNIQIQK